MDRNAGGDKDGRKRDAGFTLIELLIAVVVIGILSAILIPSFNRILLRARIDRLVTDASVLYKGLAQYHADRDECPELVDLATLEPFVSGGYVRSGEALLANAAGGRLTSYTPIGPSAPYDECWLLFSLNVKPEVQVVVGMTTSHPLGAIEGIAFLTPTALVPVDQDILVHLGE